MTSRKLDEESQAELHKHVQACDVALRDLSELVDRYNSLPLQSKRTWDRLHWDQGDGENIKKRLSTIVDELRAFYERLRNSPQRQVELALEQLADEVSNGRHETSSAYSLSVAADHDDDSGWFQIIRDLGDLGIPEHVVNEYKTFIVDWILRAINDGVLSDEKIPVVDNQEPAGMLAPPPLPPRDPSPPSLTPPGLAASPYHRPRVTPPPLHPVASGDGLLQQHSIPMDEPPSPVEPEQPESNMLWNAQRISYHWNRREWMHARASLEEQIRCVERGEWVEISGFPQQPEIRILKHLLGVCYSFEGDFLKARDAFESVLQGIYIQGLPIDDGDIAAARWLGETCVLLNQPINGAFAWAIAYHGLLLKPVQGGYNNSYRMLEDLRYLNIKTSALNLLRNVFVRSNRDATTILTKMKGTDKFQVILTALDALAQNEQRAYGPQRLSQNIEIAEGFLIQPLVAQTSWPFQQDPFYQAESSARLVQVLSRPKTAFVNEIATVGLGGSKHLTYVTKQPIKWLVEAVRYALNTYAIEWKIQDSTYLLRLSQTHDRIAYYDSFGIKFRKLTLRSVHGLKITDTLYTTRSFAFSGFKLPGEAATGNTYAQEDARKAKVRAEIADRLKGYLEQAERDLAAGKWPPKEIPPPVGAPYEVEASERMPPELPGQSRGAEMPGYRAEAELPGEAARKHQEPPSFEIAELPT